MGLIVKVGWEGGHISGIRKKNASGQEKTYLRNKLSQHTVTFIKVFIVRTLGLYPFIQNNIFVNK